MYSRADWGLPRCRLRRIQVNVLGVMALAENAIGEDAQHPYDIVKSYKGLTVHIDNTDAEGRLVLADTFTYTQKHFEGVTTMLDFATLTGACVVALGSVCAGVWSNSDELVSGLDSAAQSTADEKVWRMPLFPEHHKELEHPECDLKHTGGRSGGANTAAVSGSSPPAAPPCPALPCPARQA